MRRLLTLGVLAAAFSALALAESWSGTLIDSACAQSQKTAACTPTDSTTSYALRTSAGQTYKLDSQGNTKAAEALKTRADRSKEPNSMATAKNTPVSATVNGTMEGTDTIKVDSVSIQ